MSFFGCDHSRVNLDRQRIEILELRECKIGVIMGREHSRLNLWKEKAAHSHVNYLYAIKNVQSH